MSRKIIEVGQVFFHAYDGTKCKFKRLPDAPAHPEKSFSDEFYRIQSFGSTGLVTQEFSQSHLWFWSRGFTPDPILCSECASSENVRLFPARFTSMGERPLCSRCKALSLHPEQR